MKHILILNGPNLNLLGQRDKDIYGSLSYQALQDVIQSKAQDLDLKVTFFQSNHEGFLIDHIQAASKAGIDGIIINPGALTHYAYSIHDAIEAIQIPVIEVHLSDITARKESWRHISVIEDVVYARYYGEGVTSYLKALAHFKSIKKA